jgi:hypothetical protein
MLPDLAQHSKIIASTARGYPVAAAPIPIEQQVNMDGMDTLHTS